MKTAANVTLGLLVLAIGLAALVFLGSEVVRWFLDLPTTTMTATASVVGVVSVPVITYFTSRSLERRRSSDEAVRTRKTDFYDRLIADFMDMFDLGKEGTEDPDRFLKVFKSVPAPMITFSSRGVIKAWNDFRAVATEHPDDTIASIVAFDDLLKAIRKDLGHSTLTTQRGELVGTFVNDAQEVLRKQK